jgi:hypothetical protein
VTRFALIFINAFAAASCFVAGVFAASAVPGFLAPWTLIVGFVGLGYFLHRAERARA